MKNKTAILALALAGVFLASSAFAAKNDQVLRLFCWSEYVPQKVIKAFTKETGIKVSVENYASNEEMIAKLLSGKQPYDLIQPSEYVVEALVKSGRLEEIDKANIPNIKNIGPRFLAQAFDPENKYSVPWMVGVVGIVVNTAKVKEPIKGFNDLFDAKNKGKIVVVDDGREIVSWALACLKIPTNDITAENLTKAKPILEKWLPLIKLYDSDSPKTALISGDVTLGVVWSGEGAALLNKDKKFQWVIPEEGTHLFFDNLSIPKGAKNKANAEKFINFILRPEISKMISDEFPYLNPNLEARKLLAPSVLANHASYPSDEEMARMEVFRDIGGLASQVSEMMTALRAR